jgi:hypothetical protein
VLVASKPLLRLSGCCIPPYTKVLEYAGKQLA